MAVDFCYYFPEQHYLHQTRQHPERPERIETIHDVLVNKGWWDTYPRVESISIMPDVIHAIHDPNYLSILQQACKYSDWYDQDTFLVPESYDIALTTAGGTINVARKVWTREANSGFAICRPPGHHATRNRAMGFCLLNNVAIAAQDLITTFGAAKIAILDIDLHHGNGTQDIFWDRNDVFYISFHQSPLYPGSGGVNDIGEGSGKWATANLPFPPGTGDKGYLTSMNEFILPLLNNYKPEMLLLSLGLDAHWLDPLGYIQLTANGYLKFIQGIYDWANQNCLGRIALVLEGGYNLDAINACSTASICALINEPFTDSIGSPPYASSNHWKNILQEAKQLWQI